MSLDEHFFYHNRLIKAGIAKGKYNLYLFEDVTLRAEEETNIYRMLDEGRIGREEAKKRLERAGKILLVSDRDVESKDIFLMYKQRGSIEKIFDVYKNLLNADRMYLQSDDAVFGHLFVSFLALYGYCKLQLMLKIAGLLDKLFSLRL